MKGNTNGIAAVRQRERLIATLQPLPPEAAVELTPSLLTHLRPLRELPAGNRNHGFARLYVNGRIRDAFVFEMLGWKHGTLVTPCRNGERLIVERSDTGCPLDGRGRLLIPEADRRALSLGVHCGVLLSADCGHGLLIVIPASLCDELVS